MSPDPVPARDTPLAYLDYVPSWWAMTVVVLACAAMFWFGFHVVWIKRGTLPRTGGRMPPFVRPRQALTAYISMVLGFLLIPVVSVADHAVHDARLDGLTERAEAIQADIKAELEAYYGVEFTDARARIWGSTHDTFPGTQVSLRMPDGTQRIDCHAGVLGGNFVLSCGSPVPILLEPARA